MTVPQLFNNIVWLEEDETVMSRSMLVEQMIIEFEKDTKLTVRPLQKA